MEERDVIWDMYRKFRVHRSLEIARENIERLELRLNCAQNVITIRDLKVDRIRYLNAAKTPCESSL
jgi:hypothetical protein